MQGALSPRLFSARSSLHARRTMKIKIFPLVLAALFVLAIAVQLPAQQSATNAPTATKPWEDYASANTSAVTNPPQPEKIDGGIIIFSAAKKSLEIIAPPKTTNVTGATGREKTYLVRNSDTGVTLNLTGDSPPNEAELNNIFNQVAATTKPRLTFTAADFLDDGTNKPDPLGIEAKPKKNVFNQFDPSKPYTVVAGSLPPPPPGFVPDWATTSPISTNAGKKTKYVTLSTTKAVDGNTIYRVSDSVSAVTMDLTGDSPPTETELDEIFKPYQLKVRAEKGDAPAQFNLGCSYLNGDGVPQNYTAALSWYRKAADQGNAPAQCNLGWMFETGKGVAQNFTEAYRWYNLAAAQGNKIAVTNRDKIVLRMTPEQISEGQRLSHGDVFDQVAAATNFFDSIPAESRPRFGWGFVGGCVFLVVLIAIFVLIVFWLVRRVRWKKISVCKLIILVGAVAFILCGLFPPWLDISSQGHTRSAGYSFILSPPPGGYGKKLDIARLAVEWLCILGATGAAWIIFVSKNANEARQEKDKPSV
jgi:hypothetical protein